MAAQAVLAAPPGFLPTIGPLLAKHARILARGAYDPDTVAYWADHTADANVLDPADPPLGRGAIILSGLVDTVGAFVLPLDHGLTTAVHMLGWIAHIAADLNQPYHVGSRHTLDAIEHGRFEATLQRIGLKVPVSPFSHITLPDPQAIDPVGEYLRGVTIPRAYQRYRELAGHPERWHAAAAEIQVSAVHDILVCWGCVDREVRRRAAVAAMIAADPGEPESVTQPGLGGSHAIE